MKKSTGIPVKSRSIHTRLQRINPVFHTQTEDHDCKVLTPYMIKEARKSGQLTLSGKGLGTVPSKIWMLNDLDQTEVKTLEFCIDHDRGDHNQWWEFVPLSSLDLSSNVLHEISPKIGNLLDLTVLNLHDNSLENLPEEIGNLEKLTKLNLSHNNIINLQSSVYSLKELRYLNLSHNKLEGLDEALGDLIMLEFLDLSYNGLLCIPDGTGFLTRLTQLNIAHNKLVDIPPDITNLRVLRTLDLSHNQLISLPPLGDLLRLEILYLQDNSLTSVPDLEGCSALKELHLSLNCISEITEQTLETITGLKVLLLRDNDISSLPDQIIMLQHLTRLDLSNNSLAKVPDTIGFLPHLHNLQLEGNPLRGIRKDYLQTGTSRLLRHLRSRVEDTPELQKSGDKESDVFPDESSMRNSHSLSLSMKGLKDVPVNVFQDAVKAEVTSVDLSKNSLHLVPDGLVLLSNQLKELNLSCNSLSNILPKIAQCYNLQYLNLEKNSLESLPTEFGALENLRELVISYNRFYKIPECVFEIKGLEIFLARGNHITTINVPGLSRLSRIAVLDLADNDIDHVPVELGNLKQLRSVQLEGNKFRQPRHAILEKGTEYLLSYLRDRIPQDK